MRGGWKFDCTSIFHFTEMVYYSFSFLFFFLLLLLSFLYFFFFFIILVHCHNFKYLIARFRLYAAADGGWFLLRSSCECMCSVQIIYWTNSRGWRKKWRMEIKTPWPEWQLSFDSSFRQFHFYDFIVAPQEHYLFPFFLYKLEANKLHINQIALIKGNRENCGACFIFLALRPVGRFEYGSNFSENGGSGDGSNRL